MGKWLGLVVVGASLVGACVDPAGGPTTGRDQQSIVGGQATSTTAFPTTVALEEEPGNWFCTGTLIDKDWVLTAAHCVVGETAAKVHVRFDSDDLNDTTKGTVADVAEIDGDPGYNENLWDNDIAVVKLAVSKTDRAPTPVHRPVLDLGAGVTEVGYGATTPAGMDLAGTIRKLDTSTIDCSAANDPTIENANLLCFDGSQHASCYGDSGGPAYVPGSAGLEVAGVTSGGTANDCTGPGVTDLYTSVAAEIAYVDMFVPVVGASGGSGGSGSGSGSDGGGGSMGGGGGTGNDPLPQSGGSGCNTSGGSGGLLVIGAGLALAIARRRRVTPAST